MMNNSPLTRKILSKASAVGITLGVGGIILFIILWVVLGQLGIETMTRLFMALCLPPAVMAGVLGIYLFVARPANRDDGTKQ